MATSSSRPETVHAAVGPAIDPELLRSIEAQLVVDTSERHVVYLLVGRNGAHIRMAPGAAQLLRQVARGASFGCIAAALSQRDAVPVTASEVEAGYRRVIEQIAAIEAQGDKLRGAFWFRRGILPGRMVNRIARGCSAAFHPVAVVLLLAAIVMTLVFAQPWRGNVGAGQFWPAYGLLLASLIAHEIGHASACSRYGASPSEIGLALYFIYPVFYSNVTVAWRLKRWQRVIVDIGGVYFQLVIGTLYTCAYVLSGWEPLRMAVLFILASCLFSLNPILKFDGYWVVADALGVTNLHRQPMRILRHLAARLRRRRPPALPWHPLVTTMLALYAVLSISFWVWFLWEIAPSLPSHVIHAMRAIAALAAQLAAWRTWPSGRSWQEATTAMYVLLLTGFMVYRLLRRIPIMVHRGLRRSRSLSMVGQTVLVLPAANAAHVDRPSFGQR